MINEGKPPNLFFAFAEWAGGLLMDAFKLTKPIAVKPYLPEKLVEIAETQLGIVETSKNQGDGIAKYWEATNYADGYKNREPYCAAAVCWIVREAMGSSISYTFKRPKTATAFGFEDWSLAQDASTNTKKNPRGDIQPGDIVIFKFSHVGIACSPADKSGHFKCIEANTGPSGERDGDGVWKKRRHIDLVRSRVRFTV